MNRHVICDLNNEPDSQQGARGALRKNKVFSTMFRNPVTTHKKQAKKKQQSVSKPSLLALGLKEKIAASNTIASNSSLFS